LQDFIIKRSRDWSRSRSRAAIETRSSSWWWKRRRATWSRSRRRSFSWRRSRNLPPPSRNHHSPTWPKLGRRSSSNVATVESDRD